MSTIELPVPETDIVDTYAGLSLRVARLGNDSAYEVTVIRVSTHVANADSEEDEVKVGDVLVSVDLRGYPVTAKGERAKSRHSTGIYNVTDAEDRWEIARAAVLASLTQHGLDPARVVDMDLRPWAEMAAAREARMLARFEGRHR